jgi:hypothetical protein
LGRAIWKIAHETTGSLWTIEEKKKKKKTKNQKPKTKTTYLTSDSNLLTVFETDRALVSVRVIENDGYTGLRDTGLTTFVDEVLLVLSAHLQNWILIM